MNSAKYIVFVYLLLTSCVSYESKIENDVLSHPRSHYSIAMEIDRKSHKYLNNWWIKNFQYTNKEWKTTFTKKDQIEHQFDTNGDRTADKSQTTYPADLILRHSKTDGLISITSIPLSKEQKNIELPVLVDRIVDSINRGAGIKYRYSKQFVYSFGQTYYLDLVQSSQIKIDGQQAIQGELDFYYTQVAKEKNKPDEKAVIYIVKPNLNWFVRDINENLQEFPYVIVYIYAEKPRYHKTHMADFETLVRNTKFKMVPDINFRGPQKK